MQVERQVDEKVDVDDRKYGKCKHVSFQFNSSIEQFHRVFNKFIRRYVNISQTKMMTLATTHAGEDSIFIITISVIIDIIVKVAICWRLTLC